MPPFPYLAISAASAAAGGLAATGLALAAGLEPMIGGLIGALAALAGALAHLGFAYVRQDRRLAQAESIQERLTRDFETQRGEAREFGEALGGVDPYVLRLVLGRKPEDIAAEHKVLEILRKQISQTPIAETQSRAERITASVGSSASEREGVTALLERLTAEFGPPKGKEAPAPEKSQGEDILEITREALCRNRVSVLLQPVVKLPTRRIVFYESYSRVRGEDGTLIGPEQYLPVAEEAGLVSAIDNNLLFRCVQLVRETRQHDNDYGFFCNISPYTLRDQSFFPQFVKFMEENRELASALIFEFAQSDVANQDEEVVRNLEALAAIGFRFSMDQVDPRDLDVAELARRHFKYVKIAAETLQEMIATDEGRFSMELLNRALRRAGIELIVEKIETEQTLVELLDFPVSHAQGYLFGKPRQSRFVA